MKAVVEVHLYMGHVHVHVLELNCLGIPLLPTVDNAHVHMCFGPSL